MNREHSIQNEIRNALAGHGMFFRANVGQGWTGKAERISRAGRILVHPGDVVIRHARPFHSGLPVGFADLFGLIPVEIGPQHIGQTLARFVAIECKTETEAPTKQQSAFIQAVQRDGGLAAICRSAGAAMDLIGVRQAWASGPATPTAEACATCGRFVGHAINCGEAPA